MTDIPNYLLVAVITLLLSSVGFLLSYTLNRKDKTNDYVISQVQSLTVKNASQESKVDAAWRSIEEIKLFNATEIKEMRQDIRMILKEVNKLEAKIEHLNK